METDKEAVRRRVEDLKRYIDRSEHIAEKLRKIVTTLRTFIVELSIEHEVYKARYGSEDWIVEDTLRRLEDAEMKITDHLKSILISIRTAEEELRQYGS